MNLSAFSALCFSFGVLLISMLTLVKRRDAISISFFIFSIAVSGWGIPEALWINMTYDYERTLFLAKISNVAALFIPISWLQFVFTLIGKKSSGAFLTANYGVCIFLAMSSTTSLFVEGLHSTINFQFYPTPGPLYHIFTFLFFTLVPYGFYYLIIAYIKASGVVKKQIFYVMLGTIMGFGGGSVTFAPLYFYEMNVPMFLMMLMPLYPFFTGVALIRYGLFDEEHLIAAFQREKLTAIGTMTASLNHELKNPLFIARGKAETFLDQLDRGTATSDEKSRQVIDSMYAQLTRAADIMQKFTDFAKPIHNETRKEKIIVREAFESVLQLISAEFELNKIKVDIAPTNGLSVAANPRHFEEILFNLIMNACHAMEKRGGNLKLNAYQPNGKVIVEISDSGPGIQKEQQAKIFNPFYSTKGANGSGLGLYITKQLVERNGGKIKVDSKIGQGTTFRLEMITELM